MIEMKGRIEITPTTVECPVKGCKVKVKKMHRGDPKLLDAYLEKGQLIEAEAALTDYFCKDHKVWITPSTLIYADFIENLLWKDNNDIAILDNACLHKRFKSQLHHDNSEDAVTWNVFRFLEKNSLTEGFLTRLTGVPQGHAEVIYWSYCQGNKGCWDWLKKARTEFGEGQGRGSEPDIIIQTDKAIFFIEAKLTSGNETIDRNENSKKYETGGNGWFRKVFTSDYKTVAVIAKKYELMRLWLLGTWMAGQSGKEFYLINLVPEAKEKDIKARFGRLIKEATERKFLRVTWESVSRHIAGMDGVKDKDAMIRFFKSKTIGYRNCLLQEAFSIS